MPDPSDSTHYTFVSFYQFGDINDPQLFVKGKCIVFLNEIMFELRNLPSN